MQVLNQIRRWPVEHVAAAVVTRDAPSVWEGDIDRVFDLASVTKLLVAYAVLVAMEEGAIGLDDPAGPPGATVRHLLAHASGLASGSGWIQAPPGARRIYSNTGFEALAAAVTTATDIDFPTYLEEAVFTPLGMGASVLAGSAGSGARSTVRDLMRFAGELLSPTLLHVDTVARAVSVQFPGLAGVLPGYGMQRPNDWGLGFEIRGRKRPHWTGTGNSASTYGHFGQSGTFLWVDPMPSVACVVLADRDFGNWAKPLWTEFNDSVLGAVSAQTRRH